MYKKFIHFLIILTSLTSFWGGLVYFLYQLNNLGIIISLFLIIISFFKLYPEFFSVLKKTYITRLISTNLHEGRSRDYRDECRLHVKILYLLTYLTLIIILLKSQTTESITSPWQVVPNYFFFILFLLNILLTKILISNTQNKKFKNLKLFFLNLHFFLISSICLIIYKLGYGYDPFIHEASLNFIDQHGFISPKTPYYIGQYSLIIILHKLFFIPISFLNKWLIPIIASLFLPVAFLKLKKTFKNNFYYLSTLLLLIIPFSIFTVSTPQNLSYIFLILSICYGITNKNNHDLVVSSFLALTTFIIHPISGIPACFFVLYLWIHHISDPEQQSKSQLESTNKYFAALRLRYYFAQGPCSLNNLKKYLYITIFISSSLVLPLIFFFLNKGKHEFNFLNYENFFKFYSPNTENFILNFIYLYFFNLKFIIILLILVGIFISYKSKNNPKFSKLKFNLYITLSLLISYFFSKQIIFTDLIEHEREDYIERILIIIIIFSLPFIYLTLAYLTEKILKQKKTIKWPLLVFLNLLITTSVYLSYPRMDNYHHDHGFSVSALDFEAVSQIEKQANGEYIVLANQQLSVAALNRFGFSRYLNIDGQKVYFYPIPTGAKLYKYYLEMVEKPQKEIIEEVMEYTNIREVYFILNKYWWAFDRVMREAKLEADNSWDINEKIYIFKFLKGN